MGNLPTIVHQPVESRLVTMEFAALLSRGVTLTGITSTAIDVTTVPPLVVASPAVSGTQAQFRISGGVAGTQYKVTAVVTTSAGDTLSGEGLIQCEDL